MCSDILFSSPDACGSHDLLIKPIQLADKNEAELLPHIPRKSTDLVHRRVLDAYAVSDAPGAPVMSRLSAPRNAWLPSVPKTGTWLRTGSLVLLLLGSGCTPLQQFVQNGFEVGPNYRRPPAPLAAEWIDAGSPRVKSVPADYSAWWCVFGDPVLDDLVRTA
jgi:hypothetical protein